MRLNERRGRDMSERVSGLTLIEKLVGLGLIAIGIYILHLTQQAQGLHSVGYTLLTLASLCVTATGLLTILAKPRA
ncbi:hypothetical protein DRO47_01920 [Candidatus Bathyarchaeota archaeon]|nr:MAG: hypothetical protein CW709_03995 [Candidatus Bathyarchaeota archaeon]RLI22977.1 MAG: hypothetical protein DRO47_01920 [Candidatus Bathyarchaeota archaeon]